MRRVFASPRIRRAAGIAVIASFTLALLGVSGCTSVNSVNTETKDVVESTGTVQASMTTEPPTYAPSSTAGATGTVQAPGLAAPAAPGAKAAPTVWPTKIGTFARSFSGPVWYPKYIPKGYKMDSLDVIEFEPGSGLVADIVYINGEKTLGFTQGSPTTRDYEIISVGKTPWGTQTADLVYEDPEDTTSPQMIVYVNGGNFAEVYGDVSIDELKKVAASMVPVSK